MHNSCDYLNLIVFNVPYIKLIILFMANLTLKQHMENNL